MDTRDLGQRFGDELTDGEIIELYWARNEDALRETELKYGAYLRTVADHILSSPRDSEECVNDTYWRAWNAMPPHRPTHLKILLAKIVRECSIDRYRRRIAQKRRTTQYDLALEELGECTGESSSAEEEMMAKELTEAVERFLREQSADNRRIFVCRYYFFDPIHDIAKFFVCSDSKIKSTLYRMRQNLREYLKNEGFDV